MGSIIGGDFWRTHVIISTVWQVEWLQEPSVKGTEALNLMQLMILEPKKGGIEL